MQGSDNPWKKKILPNASACGSQNEVGLEVCKIDFCAKFNDSLLLVSMPIISVLQM